LVFSQRFEKRECRERDRNGWNRKVEAVKVVLHKNFIIGNVESDLIDFKVIWRAFFSKSFQRMNKIVLDIVLYCFGYCFIRFYGSINKQESKLKILGACYERTKLGVKVN
jgi:hypothetical protein